MNDLRQTNLALNVFCIVLSVLPIVYLTNNNRYREKLYQYFLGICISNIFMIIGDIPDWIFTTPLNEVSRLILYLSTTVYYISAVALLYFLIKYIIEYVQLDDRTKKKSSLYARVLCLCQVVLSLVGAASGMIFYVNEVGYQRGPLFLLSQVIPGFCYIFFVVKIIQSSKKMKTRDILFFLLLIFLPLICGAIQILIRGVSVFNVGITLVTLVILMNVQFEHDMRMKEQEKKLSDQRIEIMMSQIQPHFLYNSLSTIYHLCEIDPELARKSISKFSDFLRENMNSLKTNDPIPFERELNHVMNYLYLEQQRFGDKLQVIYQIETDEFFIPPLTLQPLVENAVQHGIFHRRDGGTITISTSEENGVALVKISDNGIGMEKSQNYVELGAHSHIGIPNVRRRLKDMVNGTMNIESDDFGTIVTLRIPLLEGFES